MDTPETNDLRVELQRVMRERAAVEAKRKMLSERLSQLVERGVELKLPVTEIVELTGLSRQAVYDYLRGGYRARSTC